MPSDWTQNDIMVNDVSFHYYRLGDGSRDPLVLVHGFSDNGLCWLSLARDLETEYDVIMPDARGHGLSARVQRGEKMDMTADLAGIIRGLRLARPIVAGHSMGAATAAQLGARFPDLPRALILEDPPWRLPQPSKAREPVIAKGSPLKKWIKGLAGLPLEQAIEQNRADHPTWPDVVLQMWTLGKQQLDPNFFAARDEGRMKWQKVVRAISCPTLLITADPEKEGIITPEVADMVTAMNSHISVVHIPGVGHHIRFADEDTYLDVVKAFLNEIDP